MRIYGGWRGKTSMGGKTFLCSDDVTVGEVGVVVYADEAVTGTGEGGEAANVGGCVAGNVAETVAFMGYYLNSIGVIRIGGVCDEGRDELAKVLIDVLAVRDACNTELKVVYALNALNPGPDADVIAFVFNAEVPEGLSFSDGGTVGHPDII